MERTPSSPIIARPEALPDAPVIRAALEVVPAGIVVVDGGGLIVLANAAAERILRLALPAGTPLADLFQYEVRRPGGEPLHADERPSARALVHGDAVSGLELHVERGDGTQATVVVDAAPIGADGGRAGAVVSFVDVTERAEAQHEAERSRALAAQLAAWSESARARSERIGRITAALAAAVTVDDVAGVLVREVGDAIGATSIWVSVLDGAGTTLHHVRSVGYPDQLVEAYRELPLAADTPGAEAVRSGRMIAFRSTDDYRGRYPDLALERRRVGHESLLLVPLAHGSSRLGLLAVSFPRPWEPETEGDVIEAVAAQCAQALERARLYEAQTAARVEAEQATAREHRLVALAASLAVAATPTEIGDAVVAAGAAALGAGAGAMVTLERAGHHARVLSSFGYGPDVLARWQAVRLAPDTPIGDTLTSGRTVVVRDVDELHRRYPITDEAGYGSVSAALAAVPLVVAGRTIGALKFGFDAAREVDAADLALLRTIASQCAQALERARLYEAEQRARLDAERAAAQLARLQSLTSDLAAALTAADVAEAVLRHVVPALGAAGGAVVLRRDAGFALLHGSGYPETALAALPGVLVTAGTPLDAAIAAGRPLVLSTVEPQAEPDAWVVELHGLLDVSTSVVVPLPGGAHTCAIVLSWADPRVIQDAELAYLAAVSVQCAQALDRAGLYDREHRIAETLQRSMLTESLPPVRGIALAARYLAGGAGLKVGGDWYDAIPLDDGRVVLAVGDVVGHGVQAAAVMGQLRNAVRAYVLEGYGPAETLERLNRLIARLGDCQFATACLVELDPAAARIRVASAGHPPPLLAGTGGGRLVDGGRSLPLAVLPDVAYAEQVLPLPSDAVLLLYTDGLVERRGESLDDGLARLVASVDGRPQTPWEVVDRVLGALAAGGVDDDVAVLAARLAPSPLEIRLPAAPGSLGDARRCLERWLHGLGVHDVAAFDVLTATGEALANAIEHAAQPAGIDVRLDARVDGGELVVTIADDGRWRPPAPDGLRGFGLGLMRALADDMSVEAGDAGTVVTLRCKVRDGGRDG
ncbi:MAG: SpoIIE family protein phosphatase [Thermoleophilia bacterium]